MKQKKKTFTLLEIIIVIFLITLITGAIGYNMKGTLDKGRAFRTEQSIDQLHDLLLMCVAEGEKVEEIAKQPEFFIKKYGLAKNPGKLIEDGWGNKLDIKSNQKKTDFLIVSEAVDNYHRKTGRTPLPDAAEDN